MMHRSAVREQVAETRWCAFCWWLLGCTDSRRARQAVPMALLTFHICSSRPCLSGYVCLSCGHWCSAMVICTASTASSPLHPHCMAVCCLTHALNAALHDVMERLNAALLQCICAQSLDDVVRLNDNGQLEKLTTDCEVSTSG